ncbi:MAG: bifunctional DNA-formamidopyrimidine glycosylase/DNA-(apurinic or apyrimidinic site) lyase [Desulfobulbaceae bacterium]|nr:bifunctional DNA-formamidopyrimidine glycosylase/DNA-(apurinic or apyrimidinic site) lyase [Desulfobulbaceae bacterium]
MPELPEVEVTRRGLLQDLPGARVQRLWSSGLPLRATVSLPRLRRHLQGEQLSTVDRRAKYLLFRFASGTICSMHLGMTGKISLLRQQEPRHKHDHLELQFDNGVIMRFNDARRFGAVALWPAKTAEECERIFSSREGLEPLGTDFTARALMQLAAGRRAPVKSFLMNGRLIAGIGNIYANEILFAAGVHPQRAAGSLSLADWDRVTSATAQILQEAISAGGSTIADFLGISGHPGYFQLQLKVYGRTDAVCSQCNSRVERLVSGGRSTWFCPQCQPLNKGR